MKRTTEYGCGSADHFHARRRVLKQLAGSAAALGFAGLAARHGQAALAAADRHVVIFNMHGGLSQLESWDPKPGVDTGGPFRAIPTSVPGIHISELLPQTAMQMHHLCLLRGVNTAEDDHGKGAYLMLTGRRQSPAADYPRLGAVAARMLNEGEADLPPSILITPYGGGSRSPDAAYLGPMYDSVTLGNGAPPNYIARPADLTDQHETDRYAFLRRANERFLERRRTAATEAFVNSIDQAQRMMKQADAFDVSNEPDADHDRYGRHDFGRHCLLARRLLQRGVRCIQVTHSNYDTHNENFNFHLEQMGEFDQSFAAFISDLASNGLLEQTLVVVLSEFGRTPGINLYAGRDHWSHAWSVVMAGARVQRGAVFGKTNDLGTEVVEGQVDHGQLFHTYLQAVGIESREDIAIDGRDLPLADPAVAPIWNVLT
jgi:hypothetical protein